MITIIIAAGVMGIAGSLHCLGMCGPLISALESIAPHGQWRKNQWLHHTGRWIAYSLLGFAAGSIGQTFAWLGLQQWIVVVAGIAMLATVLIPSLQHYGIRPIQQWSSAIKQKFSLMMHAKRASHRLLLGILHGLLPCGLVYTAIAAAIATATSLHGALFMFVFGIATTPALVAVSKVMVWVKSKWSFQSYRQIQRAMIVLAFLVLLRGANLGIPLLSPKFNAPKATMECCQKPA